MISSSINFKSRHGKSSPMELKIAQEQQRCMQILHRYRELAKVWGKYAKITHKPLPLDLPSNEMGMLQSAKVAERLIPVLIKRLEKYGLKYDNPV